MGISVSKILSLMSLRLPSKVGRVSLSAPLAVAFDTLSMEKFKGMLKAQWEDVDFADCDFSTLGSVLKFLNDRRHSGRTK